MVLEHFLEIEWVKRRKLSVFLLGIGSVFVSYAAAEIFFSSVVSIAMLFLIVLVVLPSLSALIDKEEKLERKFGLRHFFSNHTDIFEIYLFLAMGIFAGYIILGGIGAESIFNYQLESFDQASLEQQITEFKAAGHEPTIQNFFSLISYNFAVLLIFFVLSIFYGAGAVFLVLLNASVFSAFILSVVNYSAGISSGIAVFMLFLVHLLPEISGFLVVAIAGGIISKASYTEKFGSLGFRNVMKDCLALFLIGMGLIIIAAILQVLVTSKLVIMFL